MSAITPYTVPPKSPFRRPGRITLHWLVSITLISAVGTHIYLEMIARAGFVGIQMASAPPIVVPMGGRLPGLGTNPIAISVPRTHPLIFLIWEPPAIMRGEVIFRSRTGEKLPEGVAIDSQGRPTTIRKRRCAAGSCLSADIRGMDYLASFRQFAFSLGRQYPEVMFKIMDFCLLFSILNS